MKGNIYDKIYAEAKGCGVKNILLHSCCAPCSSYVILYLKEFFKITVLYYNPNIFPEEEYIKRKGEQLRLLEELGVNFLDSEYLQGEYDKAVSGKEEGEEGGPRCKECFDLRLFKTAKTAAERGFDAFLTTLTVSPHKNATLINLRGKAAAEAYSALYLESDFKKKEGYKKSIELSKELNLYRQDYCGCKYSMDRGKE